jgi:hypothetical protein
MNIENFVSLTLKQLGAGVAKARSEAGIAISPSPYMRDDSSKLAGDRLIAYPGHNVIVFVDFDLAAVARSEIAGHAHAQVEVLGIDIAGGKIDGGVDHTRIRRVKFQIPVSFPSQ